MVRVLAAALVVVWGGVAAAGTTRKVYVESDPTNASVFIDDTESGEKCKTPCYVDLPVGESTLVIQLENHTAEFAAVTVPKKGKVSTVKVQLKPAIGTLVVEGAKGASILVDDVDQGKAPSRVETPEGGHHVVLMLNGKSIYDQFVEIESNKELAIEPKGTTVATTTPDNPEVQPDDGTGKAAITRTVTPGAERGSYVMISALVDVGFRKFSYDGVPQDNAKVKARLLPESEGGQVIAGPLIELYPGTLAGIHGLRGLALVGRFQFGLNAQPVAGVSNTTTFWQSIEVSLRHRWTIADVATAEISGGYVQDQFRFNATSAMNVDILPDVDYQCVRIGGRGSLLLGTLEPFLAFENRIVTNGGNVQARFDTGSGASGLRAELGALAHFGNVSARFDTSVMQYSWDLKPKTDGVYIATGGSDTILQLSFGLGYAY